MADLTLLAPAKLNLFLHITGRRADGYHELQTLFQLLDHGDTLNFSRSDNGILTLHLKEDSTIDDLPLDDNLILQAAKRLRQEVRDRTLGATISISKHIPMGAGLGGGSADAAITLLALNTLWRLNLDSQKLAEIGLALGADVPIFLNGKSAWAEGVGEQLKPMDLPTDCFLVITPDVSVSTASIFSHENLTRNSPAIKIADFLAGRARNDCEAVTRSLYPQVDKALNWLDQFSTARMTGTGSSVFASFPDEASAQAALQQLPGQWSGFVARGINSLEQEYPAT